MAKKDGNQTTALEKQVVTLQSRAESMLVTNDTEYESAGAFLVDLKTGLNRVEELFGPTCDATYKAWQSAIDTRKKFKKPLEEAEATIKKRIKDFLSLREQQAREEQARLQAIADAEADKERQRLMEEAESARQDGDEATANMLEMCADTTFVPTTTVVADKPQVEGLATGKEWEITVVDPKLLLKAIGTGALKIDVDKVVTIKTGAIKSYVTVTGITDIPGCTVRQVPKISATGRK